VENRNLIIPNIIDDTRAIDQEYPSGESNVLPNFGLPRNWCSFATFLRHQSIDYRTLPGVWISDDPHRDLSLVLEEDVRRTD
jgi:hypothetical protein